MRINFTVIAFFFFLGLSVILFRNWIFFGKAPIAADLQVNFYEPWKSSTTSTSHKPLGFDDIRIFYPQKLFAISQLKSGHIPLWNPYEFSGNVLLANSQTGIFYPLSLIYFLISPLQSWSLLSFSIPLLSGFFTFLFLRKFTSPSSALFGAIAFALSGVIIVRSQDGLSPGHSILWLPLALYAVEKMKTHQKTGLLICVISLCFSLLAGWFQFSFYVLGTTFLYAIFKRISIVKLTLIFIMTILITSPHWLPATLALEHSPRSDAAQLDLTKHLMPLYHPITLIVQDFFGHPANETYFGKSEYKEAIISVGLLPLIFAFLAMLKSKHQRAKFFFALGAIGLFLGLDFQFLTSIFSKIPIISAFLPNRIFVLTSFSLCVLSSIGMDRFLNSSSENTNNLKKVLIGLSTILILIILSILSIYVNEKFLLSFSGFSFFQRGLERYLLIILTSVRESAILLSIYSFLFLLHVKKLITGKKLMTLLLTVFIIARIISADRYLYFSNPSNLFPPHPVIEFLQNNSTDYSRFVSLGSAKFTSNTLMPYHLYDVEGVDAMYPSWYGKLFGYIQSEGKSDAIQDRISVWFAPKIEKIEDWQSPFVINFFRLTGVKSVVLKKDFPIPPPPKLFIKVFASNDWQIYNYTEAVPKVIFVGNYKAFNDDQLVLQELFSPTFDPKKEVVFTGVSEEFSVTGSQGSAKLLIYSPQFLEMESNSSRHGFVVVNDSYFPSWRAKVDGQPSKIFKANYSFRAVLVPAGRHRITMYINYL